ITAPSTASNRAAPATTMFSPSLAASSWRSSSSCSTASGPSRSTASSTLTAKARNSSLFETGSVSQPTARSEERRVGKEGRYWRDWSSDVCSSDLDHRTVDGFEPRRSRDDDVLAELGRQLLALLVELLDGVGALPLDRLEHLDGEGEELLVVRDRLGLAADGEIGRASCRERGEILA